MLPSKLIPSTLAQRILARGRLAALLAGATALAPAALADVPAQGAAPIAGGASHIAITLTGEHGGACLLDHAIAQAGPITFTVRNKTATGITEIEIQSGDRILGEKENLAPGLPAVSLTLTLDGGSYRIYCPGASQENVPFTVVGEIATKSGNSTSALLITGAAEYGHYVDGVADAMVTAVSILKADIDAGDLAKAKADYPRARPFYERIESDVDGFVLPGYKPTDNAGNLDYLIDMRASNLDPKVGWSGFHLIERDLFRDGRITGATKATAADLLRHVQELDQRAKGLTYKPEDLANGAADLLEEVQTTKITGEEEAFSHYDLVDFAGNIEGARQAFAFLEPGLQRIDPDLTRQVNAEFAHVVSLLDRYRDAKEPGGYLRYTAEIRKADAAKLSRAIQQLQEPLSKIAERVATAGAAGN